MNSIDLTAALDHFAQLQRTEHEVWRFTLCPEASWLDTIKKKKALRPLVEGPPKQLLQVLLRPRKPDADWFARHSARHAGPRTVYAAEVVHHHGEPLVLLYTSSYLAIGDGICSRFALADTDGGWKLVAWEVWNDERWQRAGGRSVFSAKPTGQVIKLVQPSDARSIVILDALG